jgi:hypothetical protein
MRTETPAPLNSFGHHQASLARLTMAVWVQGCAILGLVGLIGWYVWQGLPVYFVPPGGPGIAQPGVVGDVTAMDAAARCVQSRYTFTPATLKTAHTAFLSCLHPSLLVTFKAQADREAVLVKEAQLSTQVAILETTILTRTRQTVTVHLDARRTVWVGGQQVREEALQADVEVVPWVVRGTPAGLVLARITTTPALTASAP